MYRLIICMVLALVPLGAARQAANGCTDCLIDFGDATVTDTNGDQTVALWLKLGSTATGRYLGNGCTTTGASTSKIATIWVGVGTPSNQDLQIGHQYGAFLSEIHNFDTNISYDTWTFVGAVRNTTANTWTVYTAIFGSALTQIESWSYTNESNLSSPDANHHLTLFRRIACAGQAGTSFQQADDVAIGRAAIWTSALSIEQLQTYMQGRLPATQAWVAPLICATTEPDWSGNLNSGTITSAICTDNPPIGPAFGSYRPLELKSIMWAWVKNKFYK